MFTFFMVYSWLEPRCLQLVLLGQLDAIVYLQDGNAKFHWSGAFATWI
jgi:hypothetical protein